MMQAKKDFQKTIKAIREEMDHGDFPKPMMTAVQMEKLEATVNCGGEWKRTEITLEIAKEVMDDSRFKDFLARNNATANIELNPFKTYQIRIHFAKGMEA